MISLKDYLQERVDFDHFEFWSFSELDGWQAEFLPSLKGVKVSHKAEQLLQLLSSEELDKEVYYANGCLHSVEKGGTASNYPLLNGGSIKYFR